MIIRDRLHDEKFIAAPSRTIRAVRRDGPQLSAGACRSDHRRVRPRHRGRRTALRASGRSHDPLRAGRNRTHQRLSRCDGAAPNLALLTGNVGRTGCRRQSPARTEQRPGAHATWEHFRTCCPVTSPSTIRRRRAKFERAWNCTLPVDKGLKFTEAWRLRLPRPRARRSYIVGHNPAETDPDTHRVVKALQAMEFVVVTRHLPHQDGTQLADVVFPAAELRREGRDFHQRRPQGAARPQGRGAACRVAGPTLKSSVIWPTEWATRCRHGPLRDIMDEIASARPRSWPESSYRRLDQQPLVWPCIDRTAQGTPMSLRAERFRAGVRPSNVPSTTCRPRKPALTYPLILTTGRRLEHYNCGSMTRLHAEGWSESGRRGAAGHQPARRRNR